MLDLNDFMILVKKTPFHFFNRQRNFDLSEAVTLSLKSIYSFGAVYMHVQGKNQLQRQSSIKGIISIGKKPHDARQAELIKSIVSRIKSIEFLHDFNHVDCLSREIGFSIPFVSSLAYQEAFVLVKTTKNASDVFERQIISQKYYAEAAIMRDAVGDNYDCYILAIEIDSPHAYSFFKIDASLLDQGRSEITEKIALLKECNAKKEYPSYFGGGYKTIGKANHLQKEIK